MPQTNLATKIKNLTGDEVVCGVGATDLGVACRMSTGEVLYVFGDTWAGASVGSHDWRSPVGLIGDDEANITRAAGPDPSYARRLIDYRQPNKKFTTILPSDVINIDGVLYLHAMVNRHLGQVIGTGIWRSDDDARTWRQVTRFGADECGGLRQLWTYDRGPDGMVYAISSGFQRDKGTVLHRIRAQQFGAAHRGARMDWQPWGFTPGGGWQWGNPATDLAIGQGIGEMCLRYIDNTWVLTYFDAATYSIVYRTTENIDGLWSPPRLLVSGCSWGGENHEAGSVAQLYGGYIIPGSTLSDARIVVSQWNTREGHPYRSMVFRGSFDGGLD